jgi:hydrophobe/amphiphile efflux-1 (HAE1) family protein
MFSKFFIERPRFAIVLSVTLALAGIISALSLPIKQYPDISPPQINVSATYPGADAETLTNTVAAPLEEELNGVDGMIYMSSTSANNGSYSLTVTFKTGTDTDMALVKVQNRVQQASAKLPKEVTARGLTASASFSDTLGIIVLGSPQGTRDELFLSDYATNNIANTLKRIPGMGDVQVHGAKYSVRIWLDPKRLASLGLSTADVAGAIDSQNRQASIGSIGSSPGNEDSPLTYTLTTEGRLSAPREFEDIIVRTTDQGGLVLLKDVSRIEFGAESYTTHSGLDGRASALVSLSQAPSANALDVMNEVKKAMARLEKSFPPDVNYSIPLDTTNYVWETIMEILQTLLLTFSLVVLVCYLFLQDWRVTLVPVAAIPISLSATFIVLAVLGYSINILTLFAFVLVIGTVVDNAIVVVERVLFVMERDKAGPREATALAMKDVSVPMLASTLIFLAIFLPVAFMGGITGEIYRQFAVTISVSVSFSLLVAFTLSPAMCAHMLKNVRTKTRGPLAWFNKGVSAATRGYVKGAMWIARRTAVTLGLLGIVTAACWIIFKSTPTSLLPNEDQGTVFISVQLPEGATQGRYNEVTRKLIPRLRNIPGVSYVLNMDGMNMMGGGGENVGMVVLSLENWSLRQHPNSGKSVENIVAQVREITAGIPEAQINAYTPPAIMGLGAAEGLEMQLQATLENDPEKLYEVLGNVLSKIDQAPEFLYAFSAYTADTPHLRLRIDRQKSEMLGVPISNVFSTLQTYFGTSYVNDINIGTQVNKVILQSDWPYRSKIDNVSEVYVSSAKGKQVPIQSFMTLEKILAPRAVSRYNLFPSASITVSMRPGHSTGQGVAAIEKLARDLPEGYTYSWSGMTYQEQESGGQVVLILCVALLFGYLFLVAQYESWSIPLGIVLSLPVALLGALAGIVIMKISLSVYTQLGILLLIGLAAKNAILIIEFAMEQHDKNGLPILDAAAEAGSERFRSVMMTAVTCVGGVLPMLFATGAGAGSRLHVGTTMFFGMGMATAFGIFLIPGTYVFLQSWREKAKAALARTFSEESETEEV